MERFVRDGMTFDVRDRGPVDGPVVVLLHGFPEDGSCFDQVVPALHDAGLRTLVPDQRGYSPGARPAGRRAYRIDHCAADVLALLDAAGVESAHVVGHDWGGFVAWHLAGQHPARVRSLVSLATPHPRAMMSAVLRGPQLLRSWYMALLQPPKLPELTVPLSLRRSLIRSGLPAEVTDRYLQRLREPGALTAALNWYRAIPWSMRVPTGPVSVPTTYAWGTHDPYLGRSAARRTAEHVRGDYKPVDLDAGHWLPENDAATVAELVLERAG